MMNLSTINFNVENGVGIIRLNRPEVLNSFNKTMALELVQAIEHCGLQKEVRSILITGEGRGFSAGQDLAEAMGPNAPAIDEIVRKHYNPIIKAIRNVEKPVVAAVNGVAAGAGANIALCCDIVVAGESSSFIQSFSKIGLIPDSAGTFFLPRLIGFQKASALMMLADKVGASEAKEMGLIYKVFPDAELFNDALKIASQLALMPTKGLALTKKALNESLNNTLDQQLELEGNLQNKAGNTKDFKEGVKAFIEKRKPVFTGE